MTLDGPKRVIAALGALAQETRLELFRLLVTCGPAGLPAGIIAEKLGMLPVRADFHLNQLHHAGLITRRKTVRPGSRVAARAVYGVRADVSGRYLHETKNLCRCNCRESDGNVRGVRPGSEPSGLSTRHRYSGQLKSVGSDTLNIAMTLWAKRFKDLYPGVNIEIEGKGSATAPPALLEGASQFAPMSRPMTAAEVEAFEKKYGYKATGFRVAVDALAVYVHKDNPIQCLTLPQLNRIFSSTYKVAGGGNIKTWGEVGLSGGWEPTDFALRSKFHFGNLRALSRNSLEQW